MLVFCWLARHAVTGGTMRLRSLSPFVMLYIDIRLSSL